MQQAASNKGSRKKRGGMFMGGAEPGQDGKNGKTLGLSHRTEPKQLQKPSGAGFLSKI
ncbi:MAG: hypothetical protein Fues2KO_03310 [Fuerstiella sp.]